MAKENELEDYELFYVEIPRTEIDPLSNISNDIQDDHEAPESDCSHGLSTEQVSAIARDSLENNPIEEFETSIYEQLELDSEGFSA